MDREDRNDKTHHLTHDDGRYTDMLAVRARRLHMRNGAALIIQQAGVSCACVCVPVLEDAREGREEIKRQGGRQRQKDRHKQHRMKDIGWTGRSSGAGHGISSSSSTNVSLSSHRHPCAPQSLALPGPY